MTDPSTAETALRLLVIDDEPDLRTLYELTLLREGYVVDTAATVEDALQRLAEQRYGAVISDMRLPDGTGLDVLLWLERSGRPEKTVVITAHGSAENAVEALKAGAYDYLTKPVDLRQFRSVVASAVGRLPAAASPAANANQFIRDAAHAAARVGAAVSPSLAAAHPAALEAATPLDEPEALRRLVGSSSAMLQVRELVKKVARSMAPVHVQGESGTGKELVARGIHDVSARASRPFIGVNCGAIPEALLEAEFFGYRKGAFTGANDDREGFFQAADGGTLFLDEIGDMPVSMQSKLLRVIQERTVRPVGAVSETPVNVRLISATHKDLAAEVQTGRFRQDLYYRLNVIQIRVPALRERLSDLEPISRALLERIAREAGVKPVPRLTREALARLATYPFAGNVRELENLLHRAVAMSGADLIEAADLGLAPLGPEDETVADHHASATAQTISTSRERAAAPDALPENLESHLDAIEHDILLQALERHRFNRTAAGASLGLTLRQMRYRMSRLGVRLPGDDRDDE
jgi:two-component system, NtrC family, response regulator PilR